MSLYKRKKKLHDKRSNIRKTLTAAVARITNRSERNFSPKSLIMQKDSLVHFSPSMQLKVFSERQNVCFLTNKHFVHIFRFFEPTFFLFGRQNSAIQSNRFVCTPWTLLANKFKDFSSDLWHRVPLIRALPFGPSKRSREGMEDLSNILSRVYIFNTQNSRRRWLSPVRLVPRKNVSVESVLVPLNATFSRFTCVRLPIQGSTHTRVHMRGAETSKYLRFVEVASTSA